MGRRNNLFLSALGAGYTASLAGSWRTFRQATLHPEAAQLKLLRNIVEACEDSVQGRRYQLKTVRSLRDYQERVPVRSYDAYAEDIQQVAKGVPRVLTSSPVKMLERSSGSTGGNKYIPYTEGLLSDFSAATGPWIFSLYASRPKLLGTQSYWSVSPAARSKEVSEGGLPIGFEDDTEYFGPVARWAINKMLAVPGTVARISDMAAWRLKTAEYLLNCRDLGFISVWSPTFLSRLMDGIEEHLQDILPSLPADRARDIRRRLDQAGQVTGPALWPRLSLISCWTDGHASRFVDDVQRRFPGVEIQPKGLLATEGVFSFPLSPLAGGRPAGAVAALTSHLLELIDLEHPDRTPLPVYKARVGASYSPLLSTRGGLLRYHLQDEVRCVGYQHKAPLFRFTGKLDRVSDVCGEKLSAGDAERAIGHAASQLGLRPRFAMLAPTITASPPRYHLYVDTDTSPQRIQAFASAVEAQLMDNHHYRYARDLNQLGPVRAHGVTQAQARYEAALLARGCRAGDIKPTPLDNRVFWDDVMCAAD